MCLEDTLPLFFVGDVRGIIFDNGQRRVRPEEMWLTDVWILASPRVPNRDQSIQELILLKLGNFQLSFSSYNLTNFFFSILDFVPPDTLFSSPSMVKAELDQRGIRFRSKATLLYLYCTRSPGAH